MIEPEHPRLSVVRQCELVSISRSGFYYRPGGETPLNLTLMRLIDEQFLETPWYGSRQMARHLRREGYTVGRKRVRRLIDLTPANWTIRSEKFPVEFIGQPGGYGGEAIAVQRAADRLHS